MASPSEDSPIDGDVFITRIQYVSQERPPQPDTGERAETDFAGFGGQFGDRRASYPHQITYPHQIEFGEGDDTVRQPRSHLQAEALLSASSGADVGPSLSSPSTTPTPNRIYFPPPMQPSEAQEARRVVERRRRRRRRSSGLRTQYSDSASTEISEHTMDANGNCGDDDRGQSTTPTPDYNIPSYPPSQRSEETDEGHNEGMAPTSPSPFSVYYQHNSDHIRAQVEEYEEHIRGD
ncbi:hypothetical protein K458DRAFT_417667 [Lentithecium fluviatile CBS 122367]|uniref:Uncharacterized protein n=1 Tax=Lentithecium fluviatile CBS 122367 TaxID=1168545 RepID=A0A6G1J3T8_9PLEO|nr:hypothetical protein K458DRAFT_417667 [Lentithecium fluviatile CBS 122367]